MDKCLAVLIDSNPNSSPRPYRLIKALKEYYHLYIIAQESFNNSVLNINYLPFKRLKNSSERSLKEQENLKLWCEKEEFEKLIYTKEREIIPTHLNNAKHLDAIIVENITLLPFALDYKLKHKHTKILIDLREFYPLEYAQNLSWNNGLGKFFNFLCQKYLPLVDYAFCVSGGIAKLYQQHFNLKCDILLSLPPYYDLAPKETNPKKIKILYHGLVSEDRHSLNLLEFAKLLDKRFSLSILAKSHSPKFLKTFKTLAKDCVNIEVLEPITMQELIPFSNDFDIGIITLPNNNTNHLHAMPNKFFEYLQSRLAILSTPLMDIQTFLNTHKIGLTSTDFNPYSLALACNALTFTEITAFKHNAHKKALEFSLKTNQRKLLFLFKNLF
ncbi:capsular biosynthesis protein [Helicobacter cetorum]|uniref:capsular biosynthesis protein n=1 Tax=Helicobacter cetorum TaxID=138563 RepID=UPI000CF0692F|nr:capsular biosynthesis protein [Helicobacter cetorum]